MTGILGKRYEKSLAGEDKYLVEFLYIRLALHKFVHKDSPPDWYFKNQPSLAKRLSMYFKFKKVKNKTTYINPFHIFAAHLLKTRSKVVLSIRESYKMQSKVVLSNRESFKMQLCGDQVVAAESGWASKELID